MNWTVNLTVSFVPCPPEHVAAWRRAMSTLFAMYGGEPAMLRDDDPESEYWHACAKQAASRLCDRMGYEAYSAWMDAQGEPAHWRALYDLVRGKEKDLCSSEIEVSTEGGTKG